MMLRRNAEQSNMYLLSMLGEKNTAHQLPNSEQESNYMEESKDHLYAAHQE